MLDQFSHSARRDSTSPLDPALSDAAERTKQMLQDGATRQEVLTRLVKMGEMLAGPGSVVSILFVDAEGLLRNAASPNLPADYLAAIDRLKPNPLLGTCAAAAATGCMVITEDFGADNKWAELRHLPQSLGFIGAWSMPIKRADGKVLGTFGTYYREKRGPSETERKGVERLAAAAALALSVKQD